MKLFTGDRLIALDGESHEHSSYHQELILTGKQVARLSRKRNCNVHHVLIQPSHNEKSCEKVHSTEVKELLVNSSDIFSDDLAKRTATSENLGKKHRLGNQTKNQKLDQYANYPGKS